MECHYHPGRESTDNCAICGKSICKECGLEIAGKTYCKECLEKIVGLELDAKTEQEPTKKEENYPQEKTVKLEKEVETPTFQNEAFKGESQRYQEASPYDSKPQEEPSIYEVEHNFDKAPQTIENIINDETTEEHKFGEVDEKPGYFEVNDDLYSQVTKAEKSFDEFPQENYNERDNTAYANLQRDEPNYENIQRQETIKQEEKIELNNYSDNDFIYPDHSYEPEETAARKSLEDKYERYLDDLYYDDNDEKNQISLSEQLAKDEEKFGSLTKKPFKPKKEEIINESNYSQSQYSQSSGILKERKNNNIEEQIRENIQNEYEQPQKSIHKIDYGQKGRKEPVGVVDIILTIILIIIILVIVYYVIYLFVLSSSYPTFTDALFGLSDPQTLLNNLFNQG